MIKTSLQKLAYDIGYDLANGDDHDQANLINGFCKGLYNSMNDLNRETQMAYISEKLDKKSEIILKQLVEFIELKNKDS